MRERSTSKNVDLKPYGKRYCALIGGAYAGRNSIGRLMTPGGRLSKRTLLVSTRSESLASICWIIFCTGLPVAETQRLNRANNNRSSLNGCNPETGCELLPTLRRLSNRVRFIATTDSAYRLTTRRALMRPLGSSGSTSESMGL